MFKNKNKEEKRICGNCLLYNSKKQNCRVAVFHEGIEYHIPVEPLDKCFFENTEFSDGDASINHVEQIRWWVENPETGLPAESGVVKMEYPKDLLN